MADGSSRDLILSIAGEMNKTPEQMERFITALEDNFLDTVESMKDLGDQNYKDMGFPIGLVNKIKKRLQGETAAPVLTLSTPAATTTTMIDTSGAAGGDEESKERPDVAPLTVSEKAMICLTELNESDIRVADPAEKKVKVKGVVSTLFKVISNILTSPFEPKFRKLPKGAASVREKILAHPNATNFLKLAGFKFDQPGDHIVMVAYSKEELEDCLLALKMFVERLGGQINDPMAFNPYKAGVSSTTGQAAVPKNIVASGQDKIQSTIEQINQIQAEREATLEERVDDREIQIYNQKANVASSAMNTNQFLAMMEKRQTEAAEASQEGEEEKKGGDQEMTDETQAAVATSIINTTGNGKGGIMIGSNNEVDITDEDERRGALMFLANQEKKSKFRDRRAIQLEAVKKQAHHTRSKIRVKLPDGYILQGTFGAKEKIKDVYEFVKNCVVLKERKFILFETPPKRVMTEMNKTLHAARLVPSCLLYFGWADLDETKIGDGPFLDMLGLREHIVQL